MAFLLSMRLDGNHITLFLKCFSEATLFEMKRALLILIVLSCTLAPGLAREPTDGALPTLFPEVADPKSAAILQEIEVFANVPVSLRDVISIAENRAAGTKAVDISFNARDDRTSYKVKTLLTGEIWAGVIDASTGSVIGEGVITSVSNLDFKDKAELVGLAKAKMDLSEAAEIAEKYGGGKAISAGLQSTDGLFIFSIVVVTDGVLKQIMINSQPDRK